MQAVLGLVVLVLFLFGAGSAGAADFYKGKKIRLIVSSSPGGGNDTYSRLLARHIGRHIPGNPSIIVQNMPGAGGVRAASYLYNKARRDGTVMEQINWGVWNWQVVGDKKRGGQFDFNKMQAIGVIIIENGLIYSRKDRFKSLDDIKQSGKLARVGISGNQSSGFVIGNILEKLRGETLFEYVFGYSRRAPVQPRLPAGRSGRLGQRDLVVHGPARGHVEGRGHHHARPDRHGEGRKGSGIPQCPVARIPGQDREAEEPGAGHVPALALRASVRHAAGSPGRACGDHAQGV